MGGLHLGVRSFSAARPLVLIDLRYVNETAMPFRGRSGPTPAGCARRKGAECRASGGCRTSASVHARAPPAAQNLCHLHSTESGWTPGSAGQTRPWPAWDCLQKYSCSRPACTLAVDREDMVTERHQLRGHYRRRVTRFLLVGGGVEAVPSRWRPRRERRRGGRRDRPRTSERGERGACVGRDRQFVMIYG